ncbi:porin1 [Zea mays]|uniref:Porin1 n=1 Tax=Zea mays TaxID=4577 RepID=A0A1D6FYA7_MAIZE|nr:porin1 [Zea mays]
MAPGLYTDIGKKTRDLLYKDYNTHQKFSLTTCSPNGVVSAPSLLINHHFLLYLSAPPQRTPHFICVVLSGVNHYDSDSSRTCHCQTDGTTRHVKLTDRIGCPCWFSAESRPL